MKQMRAVLFFLLLLIGTVVGGCRENRVADIEADRIEKEIMSIVRKEQTVPEWWNHDLPQREEKIVIQELPLYPAFIWSFAIPDKKTTLIHGIEHIVNEHISQRAVYEFESLKILAAQNPDTELPRQYSFLIPKAEENYKTDGEAIPTKWTAEATLTGFFNEQEAFSDFKYHYFKEFYRPEGAAEIFNISSASNVTMKITIEPDIASISDMTGKEPTPSDLKEAADRAITILTNFQNSINLESFLIQKDGDTTVILYAMPHDRNLANAFSFCLIDDERTKRLQDFTSTQVRSIFDKDGNIKAPDVPGSGLFVRGYYRLETNEETFEAKYLVISEVTGLRTSHIEKIEFVKDFMDKPQLTLQLNGEGGELFYRITSENIKRTLVILMNDHVLLHAIIQEPIRDSVRLIGLNEEEAKNIIKQFRNRTK